MEIEKNITIAFEGGMGAGKSTICKMLLDKITNSQYYPEAMEYLTLERKEEAWQNVGTQKVLDILLEAELLRKINIMEKNIMGDIFLDRSYLTFAAFEFARKRKDACKYILDSVKTNTPPIIPDVIIFLTVEHEERIGRLQKRGLTYDIFGDLLNESFNKSLESFFKYISPIPVVFIDTTKKEPEAILKEIIPIIERGKTNIYKSHTKDI